MLTASFVDEFVSGVLYLGWTLILRPQFPQKILTIYDELPGMLEEKFFAIKIVVYYKHDFFLPSE
jgi:hypothetical protein